MSILTNMLQTYSKQQPNHQILNPQPSVLPHLPFSSTRPENGNQNHVTIYGLRTTPSGSVKPAKTFPHARIPTNLTQIFFVSGQSCEKKSFFAGLEDCDCWGYGMLVWDVEVKRGGWMGGWEKVFVQRCCDSGKSWSWRRATLTTA